MCPSCSAWPHFFHLTSSLPLSQVVSVCPGFVNSSMVPDRPVARFISRFFFSCRAAALAPVTALLDPTLKGGEWLTNFRMVWTDNSIAFAFMTTMAALGLRDIFVGSAATPQVVLFQNCSYGVHNSCTSAEARDKTLSGAFYAWCLQTTAQYRPKEEAK
jgi:hypothetical protein